MTLSAEKAYAALVERETERGVVGSIGELVEWDESTYMPKGGGEIRGLQKAFLAKLSHEKLVDSKTNDLLSIVEDSPLMQKDQLIAANVRGIRREYDRLAKIPASLVEEVARVSTASTDAWTEARKQSKFSIFEPYLEQMIGLRRHEAQAIGAKGTLYDALLDHYEPGTTTETVTRIFSELKPEIMKLLDQVKGSAKRPRLDVLFREYHEAGQRKLSEAAMETLGFDGQRGRLDLTTHPFCRSMGPSDVRLTTRYDVKDLRDGLYSTIHEAGHGMYEQGLPLEHWPLPAGKHCSMGIHESQSRLWENQVARSYAFLEYFYPTVKRTFPDVLADVSMAEFAFANNAVECSFIRTDSDEVTYNLHIILRFELERALLSGDLKPTDLPGAWNAKFKEMFGLTPPNDAMGCLQDIHWSTGDIGYFPTYTLGNLYAAQFMVAARAELGSLDENFRKGNFRPLKEWLTKKVYSQGRRMLAPELCEQVTGKPLSSQPLIQHLKAKCDFFYGK